MSIFDRIKSAIFGSAQAAGASTASGSTDTAQAPAQSAAVPSSSPATPISNVDVEAILTTLAATNAQKLDWRKSIVDLMKLLDLDSSLMARKELAQELKYSGDMNHSAAMNIWLHKQVMIKLAESGGKVPDSLRT
jgi:uncharacterized protein DUF3597